MEEDDTFRVASFYWDIRQDTVPLIHGIESVSEWLAQVKVPATTSFVYDQDGLVLGWVDSNESELDQLYICRGWTGKGIGTLLLDFAKERSQGSLSLYTFQVNDGARRFYVRNGFREVRFSDGSANEVGERDVLMQWVRG